MSACGPNLFDGGKHGASQGFGDNSATDINSDAPGSRAAKRGHVHLAGGRRLCPGDIRRAGQYWNCAAYQARAEATLWTSPC